MSGLPAIEQFWEAYLRSLPEPGGERRYHEAFAFDGTPELSDALARLVLSGRKTATSMLLWELEARGKALWCVGDEHIVLDGRQRPVCVIRTVELRTVRFDDVDAPFARDYGEGDRSLAWWRQAMWDYYAAECAAIGRVASGDMPIVCERFRVVYPP